MNTTPQRIQQLYRERPWSRFVRGNAIVWPALFIVAVVQLDVEWSQMFTMERLGNLRRFAHEVYPFPLRGQPFSLALWWQWFSAIWTEHGMSAMLSTLSISVVAIVLAGALALAAVFPAAHNVATAQPFLPDPRRPNQWTQWSWLAALGGVRALLILARAVPEYIWAFLLISMLGPSAWPAILALAIHNFGIMGKLGAEVVENVDPGVPRALRGEGLTRSQICATALFPMSLPKWLLYFFYRWESCIREATVLGMLGIASLGFMVRQARARDWYDHMLLYILLGSLLVLLGDLLSMLSRRYLRRR